MRIAVRVITKTSTQLNTDGCGAIAKRGVDDERICASTKPKNRRGNGLVERNVRAIHSAFSFRLSGCRYFFSREARKLR